ncbi:response regulator transcription factor [Sutterella sp.]|uniref:response regulator transcription factor n=1 Tax=Sutterella sp. TaxID=1981025 RepID=UPI0026DF001F|nr:response regulator [Sutterella sp.]MDO5531172.1 response regulator [Sutterella sp.]
MPETSLDTIRENVLVRIVDDDPEIRETLSLMLETEGWRTAAHPSAEAMLVADQPSMPGVVLLDIQMDGMSGLDLQIEMTERGYALPVIFVTGHANVEVAVDAMRRGAWDFLQKPVDPERLLSSIESAAASSYAESFHELSDPEIRSALSELTERQREVLVHLLAGEHVRVIADRLGISLRTVQGHRVTIYRKFGIHSFHQMDAMRERILAAAGS